MNRRDEIFKKTESLSALPTTVTRIFALLDQEEIDIAELAEIIQYDPGLSTNILRLANSAAFGGNREIVSVRDALVRLGTRQGRQVVMTSVVSSVVRPAVSGYDLPPGQLLEHSIAVALCCNVLVDILKLETPDYTFTAGLLHDVGKMALGVFVEEEAEGILNRAYEDRISFEKAEDEILGTNHAEVGAHLLKNWNLPESVAQVVRWHHEPEQYEGNDQIVVDIVHVADDLCLQLGIGTGSDGLNYRVSSACVERLGLKTLDMERAVCQVLTNLESTSATLGIGANGR